jgi:hypothetical protein
VSRFSPASFAIAAGALSAAATAALAFASSWAVLGFLAMALPAIISGAWLVGQHGRTGPGFFVALGFGWALRAGLLAVVVVAALRQGSAPLMGALSGLAVGFVALTSFELLWFARRTRHGSVSAERGA